VPLILAKISRWPYFFQDEPQGAKIPRKSSQNAPQGLPNPPEMLPKSTSDVTRSALGDYVGPLIEKNLIFNARKIAQRRPEAPRRPQNGVNFEVNFDFFLVFFRCYFSTNFELIFRGSEPQKCGSRLGETLIFAKLTFSKKVTKITNFGTHFWEKKHEKSMKI
jgi:hypothetical protein